MTFANLFKRTRIYLNRLHTCCSLTIQAYKLFDSGVWAKGAIGAANAGEAVTKVQSNEAVGGPRVVQEAPTDSSHVFPAQDKTYEQDQLSAMDFVWKAELHSFSLDVTKELAQTGGGAAGHGSIPGRLYQANTDRWLDILRHVKFPTPQYDPLYELLVIHALGRVGHFTEPADAGHNGHSGSHHSGGGAQRYSVAQLLRDIERTIDGTGDQARRAALQATWLPIAHGVAAVDRGDFATALSFLKGPMDASVLPKIGAGTCALCTENDFLSMKQNFGVLVCWRSYLLVIVTERRM